MAKTKSKNDIIIDIVNNTNTKVDKIDATLDDMKVVQVQHAQILDEHMRRTEVNEKAIEHLHRVIKPLEVHVSVFSALAKLIGVFAAVGSIGVAILKLLEYLSGA
jgi:hypothetical protein